MKSKAAMVHVRTRFDLNPEQEWIQAHVAQTINLQSAGKKASLILGQDIGFQRKEARVTSVVYTKSLIGHVPL